MFKKRLRKFDRAQPNLTSLIDTVFILLIFFLMTTTFNKQAVLQIDLPEVKGSTSQPQNPIRLLINERGECAINSWEKKLINNRLETITRALQAEVGNRKDVPILISADANAPHQAVMKMMEAVRELGFFRLSFEAQQISE